MVYYLEDYFESIFQIESLLETGVELYEKIEKFCAATNDFFSKLEIVESTYDRNFITVNLVAISQNLLEIAQLHSILKKSIANHEIIQNFIMKWYSKSYRKHGECESDIQILLRELGVKLNNALYRFDLIESINTIAEDSLRQAIHGLRITAILQALNNIQNSVDPSEAEDDGLLPRAVSLFGSVTTVVSDRLEAEYKAELSTDHISEELGLLESNPNKIFFRCFSLLKKNNLLTPDVIEEINQNPMQTVVKITFRERLFDCENPLDRHIIALQKYSRGLGNYANSSVSKNISSEILGVIESFCMNTENPVPQKYYSEMHNLFKNNKIEMYDTASNQAGIDIDSIRKTI